MNEVAPVPERSRIKSLDVIRGFAVLGILAVNAIFFAAPWQTSQNPLLAPLAVTDETFAAWFVMHVFFEFKCITLFSLLFGASVYMVGGETGDAARGAVLMRRLAWLAVFGIIHGVVIWYGDVLLTYALTGLIVMFARSWEAPRLLLWGIVLLAASLAITAQFAFSAPYISAEDMAAVEADYWTVPAETLQRAIAAFRGDVFEVATANFDVWLLFIQTGLVILILRTAAVMMIGMALFKFGFLSGRAPIWVYVLMIVLGAGALALIGYQALLNHAHGFGFIYMHTRGMFANAALSVIVAIGYASVLVLLVKTGARFLTEPLAEVGRMAFSNYIAQSLIMTMVFWGGRGFGLFGELDRVDLWAVVVAVWAAQLIWSPLWLSKFQMGPLEWLWRRLSYGKPVAMAKEASA